MNHNWRIAVAVTHDLIACALAWLAAFWLRFNFYVPPTYAELALQTVGWVVAIHLPIFVAFNLYRGIWRFASLLDLRRIILAVFVATLAVAAVTLVLDVRPPRSVLVISPVFLITLMGGSRFVYRVWKERNANSLPSLDRSPVIVVGAENAAINLIKELARSTQWRVVGVFAEDRTKHGRELHGIKVLGAIESIAAQAHKFSVKHAIVAMPESLNTVRRQAIELARAAGLQVLTVPSFDDLMSGKVTVSQIRNVELDDLLGRNPVVLDTAGLKHWISNHVVLVSGAGGSIGSELCRQVARYQPRELILFELNEYALYQIEQEFSASFPDLKVVCAIGDVKNQVRVNEILQSFSTFSGISRGGL